MTTDILTESIRHAVRRPEVMEALAIALDEKLRDMLAGSEFYVRKEAGHTIAERDRRILAAFTGTNYAELARAEGLSARQVRRTHASSLNRRV